MDYLDTAKQMRQNILLFIGYILVAIAIAIATILLVQHAYGYGFGLGKQGTVIQSGLAFFSSQPNPAQIYVNNSLYPSTTNTRLYLPENIYNIRLSRAGYYDWKRTIEVDGGKVEHFDYPLLTPKTLTTNKVQTYTAPPSVVTQSPDRRWLLVTHPGSLTDFDVYDLKSQTSVKNVTTISLPDGVLSKATTPGETLQLAEWADDNQHVLLQHNFDGKTEFILLDRTNPEQSINLNTNLSIDPSKITLKNKKFDQYYVYDATTGDLQTVRKSTDKTTVLQHVLAYQSYGDNTILYVTDSGAPAGKVLLRMLVGNQSTTLRSFPTSPSYVLDLTQYSGTMYVAAGAASLGKVYIYQDPLGQLANLPGQAIVPTQVLRVSQPNYLSFSDSAQFIVTEGGSSLGVYDIQNNQGYSYNIPTPLDSPMPHATWMDGDRLDYVSGGKLVIFDYDQTNRHVLVPASAQYLPAFSPDYKFVYTLAPNSSGQYELNQTWLLAPADR
jgi:hypothetical protein